MPDLSAPNASKLVIKLSFCSVSFQLASRYGKTLSKGANGLLGARTREKYREDNG